MFNKILIANRGEIAVRIIRACKEMGIRTVAVYSTADKDALHVILADEAICIGPAKSQDSYLNMNNIIQAAVSTGAEAIHPGFGFLSENSDFARYCQECGIKFIGPSGDVMDMMGNKSNARQKMVEAGVPVVPGSDGLITSVEEALELAKEIKYPVICKASAGGGGRGMRIAYNEEELVTAFETARLEAKACFNDDSMYMEKFIENPRHIEFQVIADSHGNVCHLGERDCSIQRRNQKMIEESPAPNFLDETRTKMAEVVINAARAVDYENAGTIEFIVDKNFDFYFMEMNTRIQVEHPVTEMVTGIDLIKEQINVAAGNPLTFKQEDVSFTGHAIELRINAEDPDNDFRPSPSRINFLHFPGGKGVRVDSAMYTNYQISPFYDSMVAKLIVHGKDRQEAIEIAMRCLEEMVVEGVITNIDFQYEILNTTEFIAGKYDTGFIAKKFF